MLACKQQRQGIGAEIPVQAEENTWIMLASKEMILRILITASLLLIPVLLVPMFGASSANSDATYRALRDAQPGESYKVENIQLKRDVGTITLKSGIVTFLAPAAGRVTSAVFIGEGRFQMVPTAPLEVQYVQKLGGRSVIDEEFGSAMFLFTDATYDEIKKDGFKAPSDGGAANTLKDFRSRVRVSTERARSLTEAFVKSDEMQNMDAELLAEMLNPGEGGSFRAFLHGKHFQDLRFLLVPHGAVPEINSPEEVGLINLDPGGERDGVWYLTHRQEEWSNKTANSDENKRAVLAKRFKIETTIGKNSHLNSMTEVEFEPVMAGARVIRFGLLPALRVSRVSDSGGREIPYIQEDRKQDGSFYAILPEPTAAGQSYKLRIEYEGDHVVRSEGTGNFSVDARESWYPNLNGFADRATYELTFKVPKQYTLVSVGKLVSESKEGDFEVTGWKSDIPLPVAGFNYGLFKKKQVADDTLHYQIETYSTAEVPDYLKAAAPDLSISPSAMADSARTEAQNAMRLFTKMFGPCPYGRIAITQQPQPNFGQSWPGLVYLPLTAFIDSTHRWMLMGQGAFQFAAFIQEVTPHEVSPQWWGHMVGWASYHDQWLSEGFADFSAAMFLEYTEKPDEVAKYWDRSHRAITEKNSYGLAANDVGPIWMGIRLDTFKGGSAYNRLVYPKGAYILNMIRRMMFDDKSRDDDFFAMMQDYVKTYSGCNPSTEDFRAMVEKHMKPILDAMGNHTFDWFFRDWVYGNDLPKYRMEYSLKQGENGSTQFSAKLTQSDVAPDFLMRVPIYFDFDGKIIRAGFATMKGSMTTDMKINLPKKPKRVMLNAFHDVLAAEAVVKEVQ